MLFLHFSKKKKPLKYKAFLKKIEMKCVNMRVKLTHWQWEGLRHPAEYRIIGFIKHMEGAEWETIA